LRPAWGQRPLAQLALEDRAEREAERRERDEAEQVEPRRRRWQPASHIPVDRPLGGLLSRSIHPMFVTPPI
jgi:hypothetical protein